MEWVHRKRQKSMLVSPSACSQFDIAVGWFITRIDRGFFCFFCNAANLNKRFPLCGCAVYNINILTDFALSVFKLINFRPVFIKADTEDCTHVQTEWFLKVLCTRVDHISHISSISTIIENNRVSWWWHYNSRPPWLCASHPAGFPHEECDNNKILRNERH